MGISSLVSPGDRQIFFSLRWVTRPKFLKTSQLSRTGNDSGGRMLRLFDTGNREEERFYSELESVGFNVVPDDNGRQFKVRGLTCAHYGGSCDGFAQDTDGLIGKQGEWYLLEIKTHNENSFRSLEKHGMRKSKPEHGVQMDQYGGGFSIGKGLYLAKNKNTDELYIEKVEINPHVFHEMEKKADKLVKTKELPKKMTENPTHFICKNFCDYRDLCFGNQPVKIEVNCRTCKDSEPSSNAESWQCNRHGIELNHTQQKAACSDYVVLSQLRKED